jgi:LuxR family maltose regulon positive regulatory protein
LAVDRQLLTALAMVIARSVTPFTLVLDGYELSSRDVAHDLDYLLRHSGRRLHIVLVTRVDPILPLYRYRLEGSLTEIRMVDLAFTDAEADELLRSADVTLTADSVHALNERTHGWWPACASPPSSWATAMSRTWRCRRWLVTAGHRRVPDGEVLAAQSPENRQLLEYEHPRHAPARPRRTGGRAATRMLSLLAR